MIELAADSREAREHLRVMQRQLARLPYAYVVFDLVIVWLLWRLGWQASAGVWLVTYLLMQSWRVLSVRRALCEPAHQSRAAHSRLSTLMVLLGALRVPPVVLVFAQPAATDQFLLTLVYIGLAAGAVVSCGGRWRVFLAWAALTCGSLALAWALQGSLQSVAVAELITGLVGTLASYVHDQQRTLAQMVRLLHDNEALALSLRHERDHVTAASRSQTRFFAAASHDLRQPLHALAMHATALDHLARSQDEPRLRELSQGIQRSLAHGQALLDNLLELSRLDADAMKAERQAVDLQDFLSSVRKDFAFEARSRGLDLVVDDASGDQTLLDTDPALLRRILHNLVGNALKFTCQGRVTLSVTRVATPAEPARVRLSVIDTGSGISADDLTHVFEEFFQGATERAVHANRDRGLGLGLAITKRLAALLGATLSLHSKAGLGTTVTIELPLMPVGSGDKPSPG